jgi:hypothetical protein
LNEFNLFCYEDDKTNRLVESLNLFESLIKNEYENIKSYEIVFTKKDILIEMIENGTSFNKLIFEFGFDKEVSFKNIVEFYIKLFMERIKGYEMRVNFYCCNLLDYYDNHLFFHEVMDQINFGLTSYIDFPNIFDIKYNFKNFNLFFDLKILF